LTSGEGVLFSKNEQTKTKRDEVMNMAYEARNFDHLLGTEGLSDALLKNHFTLYQGYVNNVNKALEKLREQLGEGKTGQPDYAEVKRRLGWEFNGMRLHEYYFGGLKKGGSQPDKGSALYKKMEQDFGGFENWEKDFRGVGGMRGIGWAALYYDKQGDRLINFWIDEHDKGHPGGQALIMIMDVFEHAFMLDYGTKKAGYIDAYFKAIDWGEISRRFDSVK
jgi:Fe-Mn family superoxide dismutase